MDESEFPLMIGISVLSELYEYFQKASQDDSDHIIHVSLVIRGIFNFLKKQGFSKTAMDQISEELKEFSKKLWVDGCVDAVDENELESETREESEELFDYIFENHEYPY